MLNPVIIARRATSISSTANNVVISLGARPAGHPAHHRKTHCTKPRHRTPKAPRTSATCGRR
jgi:hypothetical protein